MNYKLQIISLLYSFGYGMFFNFGYKLNMSLYKKNKLYNIVLDILYIVITSLLYVTILYKINKGIFHIYFIIMLLLGYFLSILIKNKIIRFKKKS